MLVPYPSQCTYSTTADEAIGISNEARELSPEDLMFAERDLFGAADAAHEPLSRRELYDHHQQIVAREVLMDVLEPLFRRALSRRTFTCHMCGLSGFHTQEELEVSRF
jgi:hypothetical protein